MSLGDKLVGVLKRVDNLSDRLNSMERQAAVARVLTRTDADFRESDHPRAPDGRFGNKAGEHGGQPEKSAAAAGAGSSTTKGALAGQPRHSISPVTAAVMSKRDIEHVQKLIASKQSTRRDIIEGLAPLYDWIEKNTPSGDTLKITASGKPAERYFKDRNYGTPARPKGVGQVMRELISQSEAFAGSGGVRNERKVTIIVGPSAAGKSTVAEAAAREMGAAIVDPDEAKKKMPEFNNGLGSGVVHEESSVIASSMQAYFAGKGANMILPLVGAKPASIERRMKTLKSRGYTVNLVDLSVHPDEAARRMAQRALSTGKVIMRSTMEEVGDRPGKTYDALKESADNYGRIDGNGPPGSQHFTERKGDVGFKL